VDKKYDYMKSRGSTSLVDKLIETYWNGFVHIMKTDLNRFHWKIFYEWRTVKDLCPLLELNETNMMLCLEQG